MSDYLTRSDIEDIASDEGVNPRSKYPVGTTVQIAQYCVALYKELDKVYRGTNYVSIKSDKCLTHFSGSLMDECPTCKIESLQATLKDEPHLRDFVLDGEYALFGNEAIKFLERHIEALKKKLADMETALHNISLASQSTMGGNSTDLGRMARKALKEPE